MTSTQPPVVQAFSASLGSATANALTYPLTLLTTRAQLERPSRYRRRGEWYSILVISQHIVAKHGLGAFYNGLWTDTCATAVSNFLYFYFYSALRFLSTKNKLNPAKPSGTPHKPSMAEELFLGFIAGLASRAVTSPLSVITLKLQAESEEDETQAIGGGRPNVRGIVASIYREHGLKGFWRGFQTTTVLCLNPSLTLMLFQGFRRFLGALRARNARSYMTGRLAQNTNPRPWEAFLGAAISNTIAIALLYPLVLIKTRLQATDASSVEEAISDAVHARDTNFVDSELSLSTPVTKVDTPSDLEPPTDARKSSIRGLYQGLGIQVLKGFLSQGVTFLVKGRIEQLIVWAYWMRRQGKLYSGD